MEQNGLVVVLTEQHMSSHITELSSSRVTDVAVVHSVKKYLNATVWSHLCRRESRPALLFMVDALPVRLVKADAFHREARLRPVIDSVRDRPSNHKEFR